ncbi:copper homeostasis periplasmic binding protein CopC [Sphingomonas phyllosphaerae]|uniref:copper homeostasis periplasmic binding protein CopC n=1 Tax=Sphingomonas phyllosphaerae TaxID=257003 RepID=UPI0004233FAC|nr:copper homeostasis periplasmic binding protein CopC [Sphingomonas phyllosphaerae]
MFRIVCAATALLLAPSALAHPKLLAATPAADAAVATPSRIDLRFSEKLMPKLSGVTLMMTGMAGMKHAPMPVASTTTAEGSMLTVVPAKPLTAGSYRVDWHVVSADTHRIAGSYAFSVR